MKTTFRTPRSQASTRSRNQISLRFGEWAGRRCEMAPPILLRDRKFAHQIQRTASGTEPLVTGFVVRNKPLNSLARCWLWESAPGWSPSFVSLALTLQCFARARRHSSRLCLSGYAHWADASICVIRSAGTTNLTIVPLPRSDRTSNVPSWASAIALASRRPRPVCTSPWRPS